MTTILQLTISSGAACSAATRRDETPAHFFNGRRAHVKSPFFFQSRRKGRDEWVLKFFFLSHI